MYICEYCQTKFTRKSALMYHLKKNEKSNKKCSEKSNEKSNEDVDILYVKDLKCEFRNNIITSKITQHILKDKSSIPEYINNFYIKCAYDNINKILTFGDRVQVLTGVIEFLYSILEKKNNNITLDYEDHDTLKYVLDFIYIHI